MSDERDSALTLQAQFTAEILTYVENLSKNGILQHSEEWENAKVLTIGGSQIATVLGKNAFSSVVKLIGEKIGISPFRGDIKVQWGNLFEHLIKLYVEWDKRTRVVGSDIFIPGPPGTSYSPDGLGAMVTHQSITDGDQLLLVPQVKRVLFEFKCPFSRIPDGTVPKYYIPQVLYGLDIIPCVDVGLFVQGLFRRCAWSDLANTPAYDKTLVAKASGPGLPYAFGFIGFYLDEAAVAELIAAAERKRDANLPMKTTPADYCIARNWMNKLYREELTEWGDDTNEYMSNDLGTTAENLFTRIMNAFSLGILKPWYSQMVFTGNRGDLAVRYDATAARATVEQEKNRFERECSEKGYLNYGIVPWKLLRIDYSYIEKQPGFVQNCLPQIAPIIEFVRECMLPENLSSRHNMYNEYVQKITGGGFA